MRQGMFSGRTVVFCIVRWVHMSCSLNSLEGGYAADYMGYYYRGYQVGGVYTMPHVTSAYGELDAAVSKAQSPLTCWFKLMS